MKSFPSLLRWIAACLLIVSLLPTLSWAGGEASHDEPSHHESAGHHATESHHGSHGSAHAMEKPSEPINSVLEPTLFGVTMVGVGLLCIGIVMCLFRIVKGPHLADRVLAADTLSLFVVGLVIVLAIKLESAVFFDAALVISVLGFASTVAFSQYIYFRRRDLNQQENEQSQNEGEPITDASMPMPTQEPTG